MKRSKYSLTALIFLLISVLASSISLAEDYYTVKRVVDGDTLLLKNGQRIRLIGVDTPEVHVSKKLYRDRVSQNSNLLILLNNLMPNVSIS